MIDEELYKKAMEELDSPDRRPDVWTRACALASDDHDEARFLYTNLRVEEMLNKDGRQRTFSPKRHRRGTELSEPEKLELPELETEGAEAGGPSSVKQQSTPPTFALESDTAADVGDDFDADLEPIIPTTRDLAKKDNKLSGLDSFDSTNDNDPLDIEPVSADATSAISADLTHTDLALSKRANRLDVVSEIPPKPQQPQTLSPEQQKTSELTQKLEQQAQSFDVVDRERQPSTTRHDETLPELGDSAYNAEVSTSPTGTIRNDYVDAENRLEDAVSSTPDNIVDAGYGPVYQVLERNGITTAVKNGVSWPALLFTFPWLLSKAMIGTAMVYGLLWLVSLIGLYVTGISWLDASPEASLATKLWTAAFAAIALVGLLYIPFRYGNQWLAQKLQNRGYELRASVQAANKRDAVKRVLDPS